MEYIRNKKEKRWRGSEYANTKIWGEKFSSSKNLMLYIAKRKLISKV